MSKRHSFWAAPALTAAVLLSVYAAYGLYPFGTHTVSWCDMNQQVIPFLMDFGDILRGKTGLFLNLQNGAGMNFWGVFLFFLSSPFSFLAAFVEKGQMYYFVNILLLLKMMTCSVCACLFFVRRFPQLDFLQTTALGVMYAFCGYTMFYYQNIVWLDVMSLFPLLLLGFGRLIRRGKILLYTLAFAAVLTVNFYLCYMVTAFLVLAFGAYLLLCVKREERRGKILLFGLSTLTGALMTGVVWLPSFYQYLSSARTGNLFSSLRSGGFLSRLDTTLPVLLCTGAAAAAVAAVFFFGLDRRKEVRWALLMLAAMLVPVLVEPVNKMWHTGSYQSFPVRYGYIPVFVGLLLAAAAVSHTNAEAALSPPAGAVPAGVALFSAATVGFSAVTILRQDYQEVTVYTRTLWGSSQSLHMLGLFFLTAALAYLILMLLYRCRLVRRALFSILFCGLAVVEGTFYSCVYIASAGGNAQYYAPVLDLAGKIPGDSLARVKMDRKFFDVNLVGSMGYGSLSHYTSLTAKDYLSAMKKLGYSSYWMEVNSNGGTEFTDAILGNGYTIKRTQDLTGNENTVYGNGLYSIVKNRNALPVGFVADPRDVRALEYLPDSDRLHLQQILFQQLFHTGQELFTFYQPTGLRNVGISGASEHRISLKDPAAAGTVVYRIPVRGTQTLYFDCFDQITNRLYEPINSSLSITVDGKLLKMEYPTQPDNGIVNLGTFTDRTVTVEIDVLRGISARSFGIAGLREDVLASALKGVSGAKLNQSGNSLTGTARADAAGEILFLPVQYGSCTATVNGKKAEVFRVCDTFLAVRLQQGENRVSLSFMPRGFRAGLALSAAGAVCLLLLLRSRRTGSYRRLRFLEKPAAAVFALLFAAVAFLFYVFPVFVYFT